MWSDAVPTARLMRVAPKRAKIDAMSTGKTNAAQTALTFGVLAAGCSSGGNQHPGANPGAYGPGCQ